jgi:hypothetical protein
MGLDAQLGIWWRHPAGMEDFCGRRGCPNSEASCRRPAGAGATFATCRLASLSALEARYAGVNAPTQCGAHECRGGFCEKIRHSPPVTSADILPDSLTCQRMFNGRSCAEHRLETGARKRRDAMSEDMPSRNAILLGFGGVFGLALPTALSASEETEAQTTEAPARSRRDPRHRYPREETPPQAAHLPPSDRSLIRASLTRRSKDERHFGGALLRDPTDPSLVDWPVYPRLRRAMGASATQPRLRSDLGENPVGGSGRPRPPQGLSSSLMRAGCGSRAA